MPRRAVPLGDVWGRAYRGWVRRGLDHGYAAYLADCAERRAAQAHRPRRRRRWAA